MALALLPCTGCQRHVRSTERSCPFCGVKLALSEPVHELRLLTPLDRGRMVTLGALLSAAGIALGCREQPPSVEPPAPSAQQVETAAPPTPVPEPEPTPSVVPEAPSAPPSASAAPPLAPKKRVVATKPNSVPTSAPASAYGAPPRDRGFPSKP